MTKLLPISLATVLFGVLGFAVPSQADDHLATAVAAGGLDPATSHVFSNEKAVEAPGQGSPLSGEDHVTPASATVEETHALKTNPAYASGKTAPSGHSKH
jgi:hypothetical protein